MTRRIPGALLILLLAGASARGQYFGAGSTPEGDYLRGVGIAAWGMGIYNEKTAIANRMNTETFIMWNEYVDAVVRTQARELAQRRAARRAEYDELHKNRLESPSSLDVLNGDALNDVLGQLKDPRLSSSDFKYAEVPLSADIIRQIPFMLAKDKSIFSMNRLTAKGSGKWPVAFHSPQFALWIKSYYNALEIALEQTINAKLTEGAIANLDAAVKGLRRKLDAEIPPNNGTVYIEAKIRLDELDRMVELLKHHQVDLAIGEIETYSGTTVNDLKEFMRRHGLQFAPAATPDERTLYPKLHALLVEQREKFSGAIDLKAKK
jgi:hypothetical protein